MIAPIFFSSEPKEGVPVNTIPSTSSSSINRVSCVSPCSNDREKVTKQPYQQVEFYFSGIDHNIVDKNKVHEVMLDMIKTFFGEEGGLSFDNKLQEIAISQLSHELITDSLDSREGNTDSEIFTVYSNKRLFGRGGIGRSESDENNEDIGFYNVPHKKYKH